MKSIRSSYGTPVNDPIPSVIGEWRIIQDKKHRKQFILTTACMHNNSQTVWTSMKQDCNAMGLEGMWGIYCNILDIISTTISRWRIRSCRRFLCSFEVIEHSLIYVSHAAHEQVHAIGILIALCTHESMFSYSSKLVTQGPWRHPLTTQQLAGYVNCLLDASQSTCHQSLLTTLSSRRR